MLKLGIFSGAEVRKILEANGFIFDRQRGSHAIMQLRIPGATRTVPFPMHAEIKIGTLQSIIRQSGLPKELFMR